MMSSPSGACQYRAESTARSIAASRVAASGSSVTSARMRAASSAAVASVSKGPRRSKALPPSSTPNITMEAPAATSAL